MPLVDFSQLLILFLVLILSLTVHEAAHAWSADLLGDPTAAGLGRLSFNPAVHVDPVGTILFPFAAFLSGFGFIGWGRPLPIDVGQLGTGWRWKLAAIGTAGPVCSLGVAAVAALAIRAGAAATHSPLDALIAPILFRAVDVNVLLGVLHLLPIPPLDGTMLVSAVLPLGAGAVLRARQAAGVVVLFGLVVTGALGFLLNPVRVSIVDFLV